jgi:sugar phosphate isomerase/epimerase
MENLHLCVSLWNYLYYEDPRGLEDVLCEIREHGFGVELWPAVYSLDPYRPAYHPKFPLKEGFTRLYDLFQKTHRPWLRQALGGMRSCWHSRAFDEKPPAYSSFDAYQEEIDTAAFLGSEAISMHYIGEELTTQGFTDTDRASIRRVLDYGEDQGVCVALETRDLDSMKKAVDTFDNLGVCLDPACIRDCSEYSLPEFVEAVKDRICFLHLYDTRGAEGGGHYTPGTGDIPREDWLYLLEVLREIDFRGPAVLEIKPPPEKAGQTPLETAQEAREFFAGLG